MTNEYLFRERTDNINEKKTLIIGINKTGRKYLVAYNYQFDKSLPELLKKGNQRIINSAEKPEELTE